MNPRRPAHPACRLIRAPSPVPTRTLPASTRRAARSRSGARPRVDDQVVEPDAARAGLPVQALLASIERFTDGDLGTIDRLGNRLAHLVGDAV